MSGVFSQVIEAFGALFRRLLAWVVHFSVVLSTDCGTIRAHQMWWTSPQLIAFVMELSLYGGLCDMQHML
jgi:hypothetical protein